MVELVTNVPFNILALYVGVALTIGILGIALSFKKMAGSPFIVIFSAIMFWGAIALINNIDVDYVDDVVYSLDYPMNVTTGGTSVPFTSANTIISEHPVNTASKLYNAKFSCIDADMSKTLNPTGAVTFGIWDASGRLIKFFGNVSTSEITTTQRAYQVCLSSHDYWQLSLYDYVGARHTTSTGTDFVKIFSDGTNPYDGLNTVRSTFIAGLWTDVTTGDLRMKLISDDANVYGKAVPYDLNDNDFYVFFIMLGGFFMFIGVIIQMRDWT